MNKLGKDASRSAKTLGKDTLATFQNAEGTTARLLQSESGDTFVTIKKAGGDSVRTFHKASGDAAATYVKGWRDVGEQSKRSFGDIVDAVKAAARFAKNQTKAEIDMRKKADERIRDGKILDAIWGFCIAPPQSSEENFAKATQESEIINAAGAAVATYYGGPAGAAAYAAWSTYRRTGNADMALRAGILAAVTSEMGTTVSQMPTGTAGEILEKSAVAGAAGGIAVAAAGGDEQAIKDGFLKSAGAVLIQGGSDRLKAYSPEAKGAVETVQCVSARDVDCLSNTTWARDAKGKILYDQQGTPEVDSSPLDPKNYIGSWTSLDPNSDEAQKREFITSVSKLPGLEAIPVLNNEWIITWAFGKEKTITYKAPMVVLTYLGKDAPFDFTVTYGLGRLYANCGPLIQARGKPSDDWIDDPLNQPRELERRYRLAADQGDGDAQAFLGCFYYYGGIGDVQVDRSEAVRRYRIASDKGGALGRYFLGELYETGSKDGGIPKDQKEAVRLLRLAADQGLADAQTELAAMYLEGWGVKRDGGEAARLYRLAADQGDGHAQIFLGNMYEFGRGGLAINKLEAKRLYQLAYDEGYLAAQADLDRVK